MLNVLPRQTVTVVTTWNSWVHAIPVVPLVVAGRGNAALVRESVAKRIEHAVSLNRGMLRRVKISEARHGRLRT
jgi:hypothetical protein